MIGFFYSRKTLNYVVVISLRLFEQHVMIIMIIKI